MKIKKVKKEGTSAIWPNRWNRQSYLHLHPPYWKGFTVGNNRCHLLKSVNFQYNTLGCWVTRTIVPLSDGPIFQQFLQNSSHNYFYYFYCFIFFYNLKKVKSNSLLTLWNALRPSHQPTVLFPIYQNNDLTIRRWYVCPINPATQRIILKIVGFQYL